MVAFTGQSFQPEAVGQQQMVECTVQATEEDAYVETVPSAGSSLCFQAVHIGPAMCSLKFLAHQGGEDSARSAIWPL